MKKKSYNIENGRQIERVILIVYAVYTLAMTAVFFLKDWGTWVPQIIIVGMAVCWGMYIKEYRDYQFRAFFTAAMCWINLTLYGVYAESFLAIASTMCGLTVLLGLYCIPEIVYIEVFASLFLLLYHCFAVRTMKGDLAHDAISTILQVMAVFMGEYIAYYLVKVQARSSEKLLTTIEELRKAEKSQDDFMANMSHEIRTPINTVCGMSEMILREDISERVKKDVFDIQVAGRNLLSVVSDILDFSELESGKMEIVEEPYNITSTVNDIMNMALAKKNTKKIELIVDCDAHIPSGLVGDEQKIRRAVMNIVDNAIKFTNEGGVIITIYARKEEYGVNLCFNIKDTGIGMNEETIEKLFTSFNQVDTKRNRQEGGIGLGLAISQAIINKMGGFITVKSTLGKGSELQVVIPQKVLSDTPIVSVKEAGNVHVAGYIDMEKYNYAAVREGYMSTIRHIVEKLGLNYHHCRNLPELKRRVEKENFTHIFISWEEYCEDQQYFEELSYHKKVILVHERENEESAAGQMLCIYKPFYVLSVAAVLNGDTVVQSTDGSHYQSRRFTAPQASVLVVDDNVMNLRVVEGLLRPYKIKVFVAGSGKEALQKMDSMEFDFVFMDHMMPEMDGVETLHRIRQKPGQYFRTVPVIALTANAIGGAREMFLAEGFQDFVAKPVELSVLERVLRKYIPETKIIRVEEAEIKKVERTEIAESKEDVDYELFMPGIDTKMGMTYSGGNRQDYIDIMRIYYTSGLNKKLDIQKAYEENDWKNYAIMTHSLKSMSMNIGAVELSEMAKDLEMAGKKADEFFIAIHHEEMMTEYDRVLGMLAANKVVCPEEGAEPRIEAEDSVEKVTEIGDEKGTEPMAITEVMLPEIATEKLTEQLEKLAEQLDTFEMDGVTNVLVELLAYQYRGERLEELLRPVKEKAEGFDFMGAGEELAAVKEKMR